MTSNTEVTVTDAEISSTGIIVATTAMMGTRTIAVTAGSGMAEIDGIGVAATDATNAADMIAGTTADALGQIGAAGIITAAPNGAVTGECESADR